MTAHAMEMQLIEAEVMLEEVKDILYAQRRKVSHGEEIRSDDPKKLTHLLADLHNYMIRRKK